MNNLVSIANEKESKITQYVENNRMQIYSLRHSVEMFSLFDELKTNYAKGIHSQAYQQSEIKTRQALSRITADYDYYDLLLIDNTGEVIFSVKKESDFATNLETGHYRTSGLADSFRQSLTFLTTEFTFFNSYEPSQGKSAAFTATPLLKNGLPVGVLVIQSNLEDHYPMFSDVTDLGETGEVLLAKQNGDTVVFTTPQTPEAFFSFHLFITDLLSTV